MDDGKSPESLPSGFTEKVKNKNGRRVKNDDIDEPLPHISPSDGLSMENTATIPEEKTKDNTFQMLDKVDDPSTHTYRSITKTGSIPTKKKNTSFKPVTVESSAADDLPPGWIKKIVTRTSGKKIKRDPYYTDPVSGYEFRSKVDALRFVKTNDIGICVSRPKKRDLGDLNLVKNENLSPIPAKEKSPDHTGLLFVDGESNGCLQNSGTKGPSISNTEILIQTISNNNDTDGVKVTSEEKIYCQNPLKNTEPEYHISNEEPTETAQIKSRNSRKRKVPNLPTLVAKSLSESVLNEQSLEAAEKPSTDTEEAHAYQPSDIEIAKEIEPPKEIRIEPPPIEVKSLQNPEVLPEEQNKQESLLMSYFGDSWSDPVEFALKTLRDDIPIDNLTALYFNENLPVPSNNNGMDDCLRPSSESDVPNIFQNQVAGTSKQQSFSGLGNTGSLDFGGFNGQPSSDVGKKDNQTK